MPLSDYEKEIREAISILEIEDKVKIYVGQERKENLKKIQDIFVNGNPRVWWIALKYKTISFVFDQEEPYRRITDFFDAEENVWIIIEDDERILLKANVSDIIDIISECSYFEYNIVSQNFDRYLCETDHNEMLFIDLRKK